MKKINLLLAILLMTPVMSFLLFAENNTTGSTIVYLHEHKNKALSSPELLTSFSSIGNVILVFYADWCGPCRRMAPIIDSFAAHTPGYTFIRINRDQFLDLARQFNITSIPTLIFLCDGTQIDQYNQGPLTQNALAQLIATTYHNR
ncbi:MAG TPA: thioredoxin family protein [Candidatus Babeliales bacterium]|jgi:thioredoxin 1|nr:thioredoxin family protein [Candidatus Babeliales bacterium]